MLDKVKKLLTKRGHTEETVETMMNENFEIALKSYPEAKPAFIANVVSTL